MLQIIHRAHQGVITAEFKVKLHIKIYTLYDKQHYHVQLTQCHSK